MRSRKAFLAVAALGVLVAGFFMVRSLNGDLVYYLYPSEAVVAKADFPDGKAFRLAGIVETGTLNEIGDGQSEFDLGDGAATIKVRLTRTPPPLFDEDVPVLLSGSWSGDTFVATDALIRHDESYKTPSTGNFPNPAASGAG
jgi:cytochrome c-type biogenesis protein CcmE